MLVTTISVVLKYTVIPIGITFLSIALFQIKKLLVELPKSSIRTKWISLSLLTFGFIIGYAAYWYISILQSYQLLEILTLVIFLFGSIFVFLTFRLSYYTTRALRRAHVLEVETITDPLLGIFNRRYLDRRLLDECLASKRYKTELSVLLLDIDHFKAINDTHGHKVGDRVLKSLGELMQKTLRKTDVIARYGGEEFILLLPKTDNTNALLVADNLRKKIEETILLPELLNNEPQGISVTVSIGVSTLIDLEQCAELLCEELIINADNALYSAKNSGRNAVRCA